MRPAAPPTRCTTVPRSWICSGIFGASACSMPGAAPACTQRSSWRAAPTSSGSTRARRWFASPRTPGRRRRPPRSGSRGTARRARRRELRRGLVGPRHPSRPRSHRGAAGAASRAPSGRSARRLDASPYGRLAPAGRKLLHAGAHRGGVAGELARALLASAAFSKTCDEFADAGFLTERIAEPVPAPSMAEERGTGSRRSTLSPDATVS